MQSASLLRRQALEYPDQRPVPCGARRQTQSKGIGGHSIGGGLGMNVVQAEETRSGVQIRIDTVYTEREPTRPTPGLMTRQSGETNFQLLDLKSRRHQMFLLCSYICLPPDVLSQAPRIWQESIRLKSSLIL